MDNGWECASFDSHLFDEMVEELRKKELRERTIKMMTENAKKEQKAFDEVTKMRKELKEQIEVLHFHVYQN